VSSGVTTALVVAAGAAAGSAGRYGAEVLQARWRSRRAEARTGTRGGAVAGPGTAPGLPVSTVVVNVLGSALLGLVAGLAARGAVPPLALAGLGAGVAGGLTTFSTFALDVVTLARTRGAGAATAYVTVSVVLGVLAAVTAYRAAGGPG
jgi:CrcB protein